MKTLFKISFTIAALLLACISYGMLYSYESKITIVNRYVHEIRNKENQVCVPMFADGSLLPSQPSELWRQGYQCKINYECEVNDDGSVAKCNILKSTHPQCNENFLKAVKTWKFIPLTELPYLKEVPKDYPRPIKISGEIVFYIRLED